MTFLSIGEGREEKGGDGERERRGVRKNEHINQLKEQEKHIVLFLILQFTWRVGSPCIPDSIKLQ